MSGQKEMTVEWKSKFQLEARYGEHTVLTDQPKEDGGNGAGMSPVDLLVSSLGACIGYYAVVFLERRKIDPKGLKVHMIWEYAENPRRIGKMKAEISLDKKLDEHERSGLLKIARACTVHNTLTHQPEITVDMA